MPELPEIETLKNELNPLLCDLEIDRLEIYTDKLRDKIPNQQIIDLTNNTKIKCLQRIAKYLVINLCHQTKKTNKANNTVDNSYDKLNVNIKGSLIAHLGMSGNLSVYQSKDKPLKKKHTHWVLYGHKQNNNLNSCEDVSYFECHYVDPRRFGRLSYWVNDSKKQSAIHEHSYFNKLGIEPLDKDLSVDKLADLLYKISRKRTLTIKSFIMDSKIIVGIGNIYACEALFNAGISPVRLAGSISKKEFVNLSKGIIHTLQVAIEHGGSSIRDFESSLGYKGLFPLYANVYDRLDKNCRKCGTKVKKIMQNKRSTYFCKNCQK